MFCGFDIPIGLLRIIQKIVFTCMDVYLTIGGLCISNLTFLASLFHLRNVHYLITLCMPYFWIYLKLPSQQKFSWTCWFSLQFELSKLWEKVHHFSDKEKLIYANFRSCKQQYMNCAKRIYIWKSRCQQRIASSRNYFAHWAKHVHRWPIIIVCLYFSL